MKGMKEAYQVPRIAIRGIVLEGGIAAQSPVNKVTLDAWEEVSEADVPAESISFQVW
jgi:hypothetical protein